MNLLKHWVFVAAVVCVAMVLAARAADEPAKNKPPEGYVALFNGKDLTGWKGLVGNPLTRAKMTPEALAEAQKKSDAEMAKHWRVENGELVNDGGGPFLCTEKQYGDFEMWVDWMIQAGGDSGIYLRGTPQVQIWDPDNPAEKKNGADKGSGGLWNNKKGERFPLVKADRPVGEWNTFHIKMVGEKVWVTLNDKVVVDGVVMENYWDAKQAIFPKEEIELQTHSHPTRFRNVYIRELGEGKS